MGRSQADHGNIMELAGQRHGKHEVNRVYGCIITFLMVGLFIFMRHFTLL